MNHGKIYEGTSPKDRATTEFEEARKAVLEVLGDEAITTAPEVMGATATGVMFIVHGTSRLTHDDLPDTAYAMIHVLN